MKLNLEAKNDVEKKLLDYLENNVSETLAEKINSGTHYEKDGKNLINKKDLVGFLNYANSEARKLAKKGANCACIDDDTVFGWAIHYFEEDSIEGKLFNEDGTEFTLITKATSRPAPKPTPPKPKEPTLFDLLLNDSPKEPEQVVEPKQELEEPKPAVAPSGQIYDAETGEVIKNRQPNFEKEHLKVLFQLFDGAVEVVE